MIRENKSSEVHVQCNCCTKRSRLGTIFCRCGEKLGGLTEIQEKNAQMTIQKVPKSFNQSYNIELSNKADEDNAMVHQKNKSIGR